MNYPSQIDGKIDGIFEYASQRAARDGKRSYPRFSSYSNSINLENLGGSQLKYKGGFSIQGEEMSSESILGGYSTIHYYDAGGIRFRQHSKHYDFVDSMIVADKAGIAVYHRDDSSEHPGVKTKFDLITKDLVIQKDEGGYKNTPWQSSYLNMAFRADIIRWNVDTDSLEISRLTARDEIPAIFESIDYYNQQEMGRLTGLSDFNPLWAVIHYSRKINHGEFYVTDVADFIEKDYNVVRSSMLVLAQAG